MLLVPTANLDDPGRMEAYLDGWADMLSKRVERLAEAGTLDTRMPHDLIVPAVLGLKTPRTREDFAAAFARRWKLVVC